MDKIKSFLLIFIICFGIAFPNIAQPQELFPLSNINSDAQTRISWIENYEKRLDELRITLAATQINYFKSLCDFSQKKLPVNITYLKKILKKEVINLIEKGTSSEAILAFNRANVESTMEIIHTYEDLLGEKVGVRTTEWNVLTDRDLQYLSKQSQKNLQALEKQILKYSEAEVPSQILHRRKELAGWHNCMEKEITSRQMQSTRSQLIRINKEISLEHLNKVKRYIDMVDGPGKNNLFIKKLRLQVELGLHRSPGDAALQSLKKFMPPETTSVPPSQTSRLNFPPSRLEKPVQGVIREISNAYELEFNSIRTRNPVGIAEARSRIKVYSRWLDTLSGKQFSSNPLSFLGNDNLLKLKEGYSDWFSALNKEKILNISDPLIDLEIKEASSKVNKIVKELADRNLYHRTDPLFRRFQNATKSPPFVKDIYFEIVKTRGPPPDLLAFEKKMAMYKNHFKAVELRKAIDRPQVIPDQSLKRAYNETLKKLKNKKVNISPNRNIRLKLSLQPNALTDSSDKAFLKKVEIGPKIKLRKELILHNRYQKIFPSQKNWTKTLRGIIKDIRRAPGGVIIDFSLPKKFMNKVKEVRFDIFSEKIFILIDGYWKVVEPSVELTTLRQAWAFVDDGRVAAVDLRMLSAQEQEWLLETTARSMEVLTENFLEKKFRVLQNITVVNLHPAFIDTKIGCDLILADQVIFDLLTDKFIRVEGENKRGDIDITGLFKAFNKDFHSKIITIPCNERSILKSIISIKSGTVHEEKDHIKIISGTGIDFAVYFIPDYKSDVKYMKVMNSSEWFNRNRSVLTGRIEVLEEILKLASYVGLFKSVRKYGIANNLNDLVFTETEIFETPQYLYAGNDLSMVNKVLNGNK